MKVEVEYSHWTEWIDADQLQPGMWRLTRFSNHMPLCPGDVVRTERGLTVTDVLDLSPVFLVEVYFQLGTPQTIVSNKMDEWGRAVRAVQQVTALSVAVAFTSLEWIRDVIAVDPVVSFVDNRRVPHEVFSFRRAREVA